MLFFLRRSNIFYQVSVVLKRTVVDSDLIFDNLWSSFLCRIRVSCLTSTNVITVFIDLIGQLGHVTIGCLSISKAVICFEDSKM